MKIVYLALAAAAASFTTAAQADTVTYNSTPTDGWFYGSGNNYTPANTAVLDGGGVELYLRAHKTFEVAPASDGAGVYSFALGTDPISFDWGTDFAPLAFRNPTAQLTITNIGTGATFSYDPFAAGNDNATGSGSRQNSARLNWFPVGFDSNVDSTYKVTLDFGGTPDNLGEHSLSIYARLGVGAAVPEPATWAMMIAGFGMVGGAMRRRKVSYLTSATA